MAPSSRHSFLTEEELAAWQGMLQVHAQLLRELDVRLRAEHRLSVSEFDVLITLFNAEGHQLRMSALAAAIMLSPAGLTHLATRLERDGLVERRNDPIDRRSLLLHLTEAGAERLREARETHNALVRDRFLDRLSAAHRRGLARIWAAVLA